MDTPVLVAALIVVATVAVVGVVVSIHVPLHLVSVNIKFIKQYLKDIFYRFQPSQLLGIPEVTLIVNIIALAHTIPVGLTGLLLLIGIIGQGTRRHRGIALQRTVPGLVLLLLLHQQLVGERLAGYGVGRIHHVLSVVEGYLIQPEGHLLDGHWQWSQLR